MVVGNAGTNNGQLQLPLANSRILITKNGYFYVWVSNETPGWDVFFDNLSVTHRSGPVLEETHYYPFGLTMAGTSSKALKTSYAENKKRFNDGTELNTDLDVSLYETDFRLYDPQIGRFAQVDDLGDIFEDWSPYNFANDNPILLNDPLGLANDTAWKKLPEVIITNTPRPKALSIINTPGMVIQKNPNFNPFDKDPYKRQEYVQYQAWSYPTINEKLSFGQTLGDFAEFASWIVPESKLGKGVSWLFRLRKIKQVLGIAKFAYASKYGIKSYKALKALNKIVGTQVHHLIEKRFAGLFGQNAGDMLSIVLTESEHQAFTNAWRGEIGYEGSNAAITTLTATKEQVQASARKIYADYPEILKALGLQ
jgi:RHS repeat-associated protein